MREVSEVFPDAREKRFRARGRLLRSTWIWGPWNAIIPCLIGEWRMVSGLGVLSLLFSLFLSRFLTFSSLFVSFFSSLIPLIKIAGWSCLKHDWGVVPFDL
ncbi:hypothetical protein BDV38DRAFT_263648 [Aspergillus pseudotamarii]|uniref:Uncharacterized protein n=1 Tax=Aspergillus pseudotamarii TaxID=132259 RepID=A0A5N6SAT8_ASPPS|nr:uncharacterized protein BDV38DRAFT_263648 [Aspergillus pseudotamarii]KAE8131705.1 hypothetical protein BDV38DRAFT_263648 [Aspergillus pseudotamarii]